MFTTSKSKGAEGLVWCFKPFGGLFWWPFLGGGPGPGVSLTLCCFVVYSTRRFVLSLALCCFVLVFLVLFGVAVTSLWEGGGGGGGVWSWCFSCVCSICAYLGLSVSSSSSCLG